jgi:zinc protease
MPTGQTQEKREVTYDRLAPLPRVQVAFAGPPAKDPDTPVFEIISQILAAGESSRLNRSLVRDKQVAVEADGGILPLKLASIFYVLGVGAQGKSPVEIEKGLEEQLDLLRNEPVTPAEMTKARNQVLNDKVFGSLSTEQKASRLGQADLDYGDPGEANRQLDAIANVTAADVQRVARKYLGPERRNVLVALPESMRPGTAAKADGSSKGVNR